MTAALLGGFVLGVAGSAHCAVMCGPLVATFAPGGTRALLHHLGRLLVYVAVGVAAGATGAAFAWAGFGRPIAIAAAILLVAQAVMRFGSNRGAAALWLPPRWLRQTAQRALQWSHGHRVTGPLLIGSLNGLLPCGLVHAGAVAAAGLGTAREGALLMAAFGAGTLPVLVAGGAFAAALGRRRAGQLARYSPVLMIAVAVLLILRATAVTHAH